MRLNKGAPAVEAHKIAIAASRVGSQPCVGVRAMRREAVVAASVASEAAALVVRLDSYVGTGD